jgi:hypothetical protein
MVKRWLFPHAVGALTLHPRAKYVHGAVIGPRTYYLQDGTEQMLSKVLIVKEERSGDPYSLKVFLRPRGFLEQAQQLLDAYPEEELITPVPLLAEQLDAFRRAMLSSGTLSPSSWHWCEGGTLRVITVPKHKMMFVHKFVVDGQGKFQRIHVKAFREEDLRAVRRHWSSGSAVLPDQMILDHWVNENLQTRLHGQITV